MIVNGVEIGRGGSTAAETVIVGSGPVGLVLALLLARRGNRVLLIEGGNSFASADVSSDLDVEYTASVLSGGSIGRTRQVGGGLNLWGGQLASFEPSEFDAQSDQVSGWPIFRDEIVSRFPAVAEILGESSVSLPPTCNTFDTEKSALAAEGLGVIATAWLRRPKLPSRLWKELNSSPTLTLVQGAFADKILLDEVKGAVKGISAILANGARLMFAGANVILACGTIETCRLLLQKSVSGGEQPWHTLSWLGRGFNEHLDADTATIQPLNRRRLLDLFDPIMIEGTKYTHKVFCRTELADGSSLSSVAMLNIPGNLRNSVAELRALLFALAPREAQPRAHQIACATLASSIEIFPLAWRYLRHKRLGSTLRSGAKLRVSVEQPIRMDNRITLSSTRRDSRGVPTVIINWRKGYEEGLAFLATTRKIKRWAEANQIANVQIDPLLLAEPGNFVMDADDGLHHAGGTRMARNPQDGVVDTDLKVFGVDRLYCCGSSVFPRTGFANPTMTAMALSVRLGDYLIKTGRAQH